MNETLPASWDDQWTTGGDPSIKHIRKIGFGACGEVHELKDLSTSRPFARKLVRPFGGVTQDDIRNELRALDKLCRQSAPNIVRVLRHALLPQSAFYYIDMELCDLNLDDYIQGKWPANINRKTRYFSSTDTSIARDIIVDIASGVAFIHGLGEVHRDLKPRNILYSMEANRWKIADFGTTVNGTSHHCITTTYSRGTPSYRAPELLSETPFYNNKSDIWAVGCILYEVLTGKKAFEDDWSVKQYISERRVRWIAASSIKWSTDIVTLNSLESMVHASLELHHSKRPSANDFCKAYVTNAFDGQELTLSAPLSETPVRAEDVQLLQDVCSHQFAVATMKTLERLIQKYAISSSTSISHPTFHHAILAYAPQLLTPRNDVSREYHTSECHKALQRRISNAQWHGFDEEDLAAICFMAFVARLEQDQSTFEIHMNGFVAMTNHFNSESKALTAMFGTSSVFRPLLRDLILIDSRYISVSDATVLLFVGRCRESIGPMTWTQRSEYLRALHGEHLPWCQPFSESVWQYSVLLRRCFRETLRHQIEGNERLPDSVSAVVSEIRAAFDSQEAVLMLKDLDKLTRSHISAACPLSQGQDIIIFVTSMFRFCRFLMSVLEAKTLLEGCASPEARHEVISLMSVFQAHWLMPNRHNYCFPQSYTRAVRMVWTAGVAIRQEAGAYDRIPILLELAGQLQIRNALDRFRNHRDSQFMAELFQVMGIFNTRDQTGGFFW